MAKQHTIEPGDCIDSIAAAHGRLPEAIWDAPQNAELKSLRKDPNLLLPGDTVAIPDPEGKKVRCATGRLHTFRRRTPVLELRVRVFDEDFEAHAGAPWTIEFDDGRKEEGTIDDRGFIVCPLTPTAKTATLRIPDDAPDDEDELGPPPWEPEEDPNCWEIVLGTLEPLDPSEAEENQGLRNRLANLALLEDGADDADDAAVRAAISTVQEREGIPVTGLPDTRTLAALDRLGRG